MIKKIDLLMTGVGGQGTILASDIIAEVALAGGYDVKKTDTLGMAQRGGSVISHIRIAPKVHSPLIKEGEVDILLAFEKIEAARWGYYLKPEGIAIVNNLAMPPLSVSLGNDRYPSDEEITDILKQTTDRIYLTNGSAQALELGDIRVLNIFMLGCASVFMPLEVEDWKEGIAQRLPEKIRRLNLTAFDLGRKEIEDVHLGKDSP